MTTQSNAAGPLSGLRVIEVAGASGEYLGRMLGDWGADVIKVEPPGGVPERRIGPFYKDVEDPNRSLHFWHYNTNKRSVTLDINSEGGRGLLRKLVAEADVLLETMPPGTFPAIGLGYDALAAENPRLVMCSLTPFGQYGPWRDYQTSDMLHLAAGGQMAACGYEELEDDPEQRPIAAGGNQAWHVGCHFAYIAITSALFLRNVTGEGQYIDSSVHEALALTTEGQLPRWIYYKDGPPKRQVARQASTTPSPKALLRAADGKYVQMTNASMNIARLKPMVEWMNQTGQAEDLMDPKYYDPARMVEHRAHVSEVVTKFMSSLTAEEAMKGGQEIAGGPWGTVRAAEDLLGDEHFESRGFFVQVEHPELGETFTYEGAPAVYSASPWRITRRAPLIGEHNAEVYAELGLDAAAIGRLQTAGAI
jgi:crotonobetainyl-CoA:carnitine CoA-transferase CaiB-like acyl-CoA transferase